MFGTIASYDVDAFDGRTDDLMAGGSPIASGDAWGVVPRERWGRLHSGHTTTPRQSERGDWTAFYTSFANAVRGRGDVPVDPWDAVAGLDVLEAAQRSATTGRAVGEDYDTADVLLLGRETYDSFAGAWPDREAAGGDDAPFAKQLGDMRKVVVSRQPLEFSWRNSELIQGDLLDAVTSLKADAGIRGILIPGSISVVQQLLAAGLVDELRLLVHPVAARRGRKLFDDGDAPYHLRVTATEVFPTGVIRVIYSPTEAPTKVGYDEVKDQVPGGK